jgi:opacity protein-like surface antigen
MIDDVSGDDWLRGNFEVAPEIFGAGIWHRSGNYIAGWTLWGRYNVVPRNWRLTPFIQLGAGAVLTDISHQCDGQNFNFNLDAAVGARYFIRKNISIDAEFRYQHISNADTGRRNIGINAIGPVVGVSWFF